MALNVVQEAGRPLLPLDRHLGVQSVRALHSFNRRYIHLATLGFTLAGVMAIAPSAMSQSTALSPRTAQSETDATVQPSTCTLDPQGLMCNTSSPESKTLPVASQAAQTGILLQPLTSEQMERLSDILLGMLYFVLPIGFGLTLFLHDRYQAYRMATLKAQIKLLEKLWEQSPQA